MKYVVLISLDALQELEAAYQWLAEQSPQHSPRWHDALIDALLSLEERPTRCPIVQHDGDTSGEDRQLLFGDKLHAYRIVFYIQGDRVVVGQIRHASRRF